ncbi:hypothetical protein SCP_0112030 [Sparassis crispa]|uniref:DUF1764-domain-containing protein n=1 Tax=Sparassis crispa TaxID=139825 RepID=A0A401G849_9APHY|nr:hypothetical protein SCP_0112030 [Sparassis crispa]GBE78318.1 hypothetical protein SCP_0112030 [Sparassis crispa]
MPASEIDEIFASKGKSSAPKPSSSAPSTDTPPKKTKKSGKRKREAKGETEVRDESESKKSTKRRVPETVLDPSARIAAPATSNKSTKLQNIASDSAAKKKSKKAIEVEDRFKDSRGTGSRRTTEEGFAIYKESDLGITEQGGNTPLCPFDCQCCF